MFTGMILGLPRFFTHIPRALFRILKRVSKVWFDGLVFIDRISVLDGISFTNSARPVCVRNAAYIKGLYLTKLTPLQPEILDYRKGRY